MNKYPAYLLFFALYPVLALWSQNIQEVGFGQIVRVAIASLLLSMLLWLASSLILRNRDRAGLVTVVVLIVFFSYGHLYESARGWSFELARHRYLLPLIIIVMIAWAFYVIRIKQVGRFTEFF
ncbi:MAG TPA: hypothetical protein VFO91_01425, partial [Anaerolineales bacterium]|nr:hypothetical protein [Anaerolineales bacterium]